MDHEFEDVEVKINAPELLEKELRSKRQRCMIGTGSMCDPYLPLEGELGLTRRCLEIIDRYGFGVSLLTKSNLVLRDMDVLKSINEKTRVVVQMTVTAFDDRLCRIIEPCVCPTSARFDCLKRFKDAGIETFVWMTPILPFINDNAANVTAVLDACAEAGVSGVLTFGMGVTLRDGDREYFYKKLDESFPGMKEKYIRSYGNSYVCESPDSRMLTELFERKCREYGIMYRPDEIFRSIRTFRDRYRGEQLSLF